MSKKNRLAFVFVWLLFLCAGVSSFLVLKPATVIPKNQAITAKKFECEFIAYQRTEVGIKSFQCVDDSSLKNALVASAGLGGVTLAALGYVVVFRRTSRSVSEWRDNLRGYLALVGTWIWMTALYVSAIRLTHVAYGRVNLDYLFVTSIWMAIVVVLPLAAWMKSKIGKN